MQLCRSFGRSNFHLDFGAPRFTSSIGALGFSRGAKLLIAVHASTTVPAKRSADTKQGYLFVNGTSACPGRLEC